MATSRTCWACQTVSHMTVQGDPRYTAYKLRGGSVPLGHLTAVYLCDNCGYPSVAIVPHNHSGRSQTSDWPKIMHDAEKEWIPEGPVGKDYPDVPTEIAAAADEAYRCASIRAYRGASILARAVIEATAKAKNITMNGIYPKIEAMAKQGVIREHVKDAAHELRHLGNDMAHGDFGDEVTEQDVTHTLVIMDEVLLEVFQSPARTAKIKADRLARVTAAKGH